MSTLSSKMLLLFVFSFVYTIFAQHGPKLVPKNIPLRIHQNDISNIALSSDGLLLCVTTWGGDTNLLWTNGSLIQEFKRNADIGEYMVMCSFSPNNRFLIINSALEYTNFCTKGYISLYLVSPLMLDMPWFTEQTTIRQNCEFPWPTTYTFSDSDMIFAYVNFTSNMIAVYNFDTEDVNNIVADTDAITTMIFSQDRKYLIWKQSYNGTVTMYDLETKSIYKHFSIIRDGGTDSSDVIYYTTPSMMINEDNSYLIDCSSNTASTYIINVENSNVTTMNSPWMGANYIVQGDSLWYVSMPRPTYTNTLSIYDMTTKKTKNILPCSSKYFSVCDKFIVTTNNTELIVCLRDFRECLTGNWTNNLILSSCATNAIYTTDSLNNLIKWNVGIQ